MQLSSKTLKAQKFQNANMPQDISKTKNLKLLANILQSNRSQSVHKVVRKYQQIEMSYLKQLEFLLLTLEKVYKKLH